ncbi:MAG: hypothetical protein IPL59_05930 [Candidatus Competibacteraceae bacterium]|nr:hypothetical protein [Candidatus Competibacteraceae bacterium]
MAPPVAHPGGFHRSKTAFPLGDGVLVGTQNSGRRPQPFAAPPQRGCDLADRRLDILHRCARRL